MSASTFIATLVACFPLVMANQFVMYTPGGDDTSVQRIDPILFPGAIGQHVHQVFGSNALSDSVTYDSLQAADCTTVGDASDHGNAFDSSLYWHPALFMEAKNGSGYVRVPTNGHKLYYKDAGSSKDTKRSPFEFPHGFRMLAGNPFLRAALSDVRQQNITQWVCHNSDGNGWNQGTDGGFPKGVKDCAAYPGFNGAIHFPHCWNGKDFDPAAPFAHVAYPDGDIEQGECPASHSIRLPHIFIENQFDLHKVVDQVIPNTFVLAQGDDTGYGWHADFLNGWQDGAIPALLESCPYAFYGNEDVGVCTSFKARTKKASDCKLPTKYAEEVTYPGPHLPGCNPIINNNPAPVMPVAALGVATDVCNAMTGTTSALLTPPASMPVKGSLFSTTAQAIATAFSQGPAADSITKPAGTTVYSAPQAFSVPTTFATFFTTAVASSLSSTSSLSYSFSSAYSSPVSCPASNGQTYTSNGVTFQIECDTDHMGGDMSWRFVKGGLIECINACATTAGCVDVSLSGVACYLKKSLGRSLSNSGIHGARLISSGFPASSTVTAPPAYQSAGDVETDVHVEWVTQYEYYTITAQHDTMHRRHADFHAA